MKVILRQDSARKRLTSYPCIILNSKEIYTLLEIFGLSLNVMVLSSKGEMFSSIKFYS